MTKIEKIEKTAKKAKKSNDRGATGEAAALEIRVKQVTRKTAAGSFTYVVYKDKCFRRAAKRGRPHYEEIAGFTFKANEDIKEVSLVKESQLGRLFGVA